MSLRGFGSDCIYCTRSYASKEKEVHERLRAWRLGLQVDHDRKFADQIAVNHIVYVYVALALLTI